MSPGLNGKRTASELCSQDRIGVIIHVTGVVQGVGFRPFIYGLSQQLGLTGWVRNTSAGVEINIDGFPKDIDSFTTRIETEKPPLARIDTLTTQRGSLSGYSTFEIIQSVEISHAFQPISPDIGICPDCLTELFNPDDRRYLYPFTNCTNCGPRYTIIRDIPYDRPNTTMGEFSLCPECSEEYHDPLNRRFHAQPVACPNCGPRIWLEQAASAGILDEKSGSYGPSTAQTSWQVVAEVQSLLARGKIIAIKGLGGFHIACDATNQAAVAELRKRKLRVDKPFAVMMPNLETVQTHCWVSVDEQEALESHERPIVILKRLSPSTIAAEVSPNQDTVGVMLPYTPLHYLLFLDHDQTTNNGGAVIPPQVLVMTSGNLSEEPIVTDNDEARQRLKGLVDLFLMHNRPIFTRCDDSVVRLLPHSNIPSPDDDRLRASSTKQRSIYPIRRSRGYAPLSVNLPWDSNPLLATGGELKNTICLAKGQYAFLSQHIGDLENYETVLSFEDTIRHMERLFKIDPAALVYDLHPDYASSRYALTRASQEHLPALGVQHHHAHVAACMVDNQLALDEAVLGVAFDGTGYGDDSTIWGGEFLLATYYGYKRIAQLKYMPLPGGDTAIRHPARIALAYLWIAGQEWEAGIPAVDSMSDFEMISLRSMLEKRLNTPQTSSMGRLFDAAASLAGVRQVVNYEGQAAIELEAIVDHSESCCYPFRIIAPDLENQVARFQIDPNELIVSITEDVLQNVPASIIAARFHNTIAQMVVQTLTSIRNSVAISKVVLSGGVWQNLTLLSKTLRLLNTKDWDVYIHHQVPANDGGIALGQAAIATANLFYKSDHITD